MKEPKIRFKGFTGEWVEKALKEVAPLQRGFDLPSHSICRGFIPIAYSNGVLNYHNIGKCYAPGLVTGRSGTIGKFTFIESGMYWPHNTSLWVTNFFNNVPKYIYYMYHTIGIEKYSTGSGVPTLNRNDVHDIIIYCPSIAEQQSIADYFTNLDTLIQSTTKKIESLKQVKAASLQSMFPQEGETTPRVRFKGFEGEWEEVSLGEETYPAGIKNHDNLPLESYSISNEFGFIPQNVQFENGGTMATADKRMYYIVSKNSFGYNPARINVGSLGYYTGDVDVIVSSLYEIFKTSDRICDTFLLYWFKTSTFQKLIEQYQEGGVRFYFFYDKLCMCHTLVPSYEEQKKIASYFTNLDSQITLQNHRLEKLKQIKAACLDNMFV